MKVGDLVRVRMAHRAGKNGIVIRTRRDESNSIIVVRPQDGTRDIYCNPSDVRVLSEGR